MRILSSAVLFALAASTLVVIAPAGATTFFPEEITCPVGGEKFSVHSIGSYTTFGARPDGKPIGTLLFPVPLHVCPGNGLVIYKRDFSDAEKTRLSDLVNSAEFRALAAEPEYHRAAWLAQRLGETPGVQAWLRLQASWSVDNLPDKKKQFQQAFVDTVDDVDLPPTSLNWWALQARAVNAERELGQFTAAAARIATVRKHAGTRLVPSPEDGSAAEVAKARDGWLDFLTRQAKAIGRRDRSPEPAEFMARRP